MVIKYVKSVELNTNIVVVFLEERKNTSYELRVRISNPQVTLKIHELQIPMHELQFQIHELGD